MTTRISILSSTLAICQKSFRKTKGKVGNTHTPRLLKSEIRKEKNESAHTARAPKVPGKHRALSPARITHGTQCFAAGCRLPAAGASSAGACDSDRENGIGDPVRELRTRL